jgi:hypothetical protein
MSNMPPSPLLRGRRMMPRPRLRPPPLSRTESRRLAWEKEKATTHHLEQQLATAQGIVIHQDDDDDRSINVGSNPDASIIAHLHTQAIGL